jgi:hypothetical protein
MKRLPVALALVIAAAAAHATSVERIELPDRIKIADNIFAGRVVDVFGINADGEVLTKEDTRSGLGTHVQFRIVVKVDQDAGIAGQSFNLTL